MTAEAAKAEETAVEATGEELRVAEVRAAVVREAEAMEEGSYSTASRLVTATKRAIVHKRRVTWNISEKLSDTPYFFCRYRDLKGMD